MFATLPRRKPQRYSGCLTGWNVVDAWMLSVRAWQGYLNSMAGCTGVVHDLKRQRDLLANKRGLRGFECYRYPCEIDQSMRNRN